MEKHFLQEMTDISDVLVYLPMPKPGHFLAMVEQKTGRKYTYAFTSLEKAEAFFKAAWSVNLMEGLFPEGKVILFPCTISEYRRAKKKDPALCPLGVDLEANAEALKELILGEAYKEDIRSVLIEKNGAEYYFIKKTKHKTIDPLRAP